MNEDAKKWIYWTVPIVVVIGLAVALYYARRQQTPAEETVQTEPTPSVAPPVQHPIEEQPSEQPLPSLADSDAPVHESLTETFGRALEQFLVPQDIVRHVVVTIDNLPRKKTAVQMWPVKPTSGELVTTGPADTMLSAENAARYEPIMKIVRSADMSQVAALYKRFYPLFQEAYVDLGYPEGYFNDRLVEVIDHLLATPDVQGQIRLTQPGVFYQFADPSLEERSAGQKLLLRMGSEHAATVKQKLRELRTQIIRQENPPAER